MKALLLAAGFGTRLKPYTENCPKCLMSINGRVLLGIWLKHLESLGIEEIYINTHYLKEQVEDYVATLSLRSKVHLRHESTLLGTAGTVLSLADELKDDDVLIAHADNYLLGSIAGLIREFKRQPEHIKMSMVTFKTEHPERCGIVELDSNGVVRRFYEKSSNNHGNLANGAIYCCKPALIDWMLTTTTAPKDLSLDVIPLLMGQISTWHLSEGLIDIGTPDTLSKAQKMESVC